MEIAYSDFRRMHEPLKEQLLQCYEKVYNSQWFIQGEQLKNFEQEFSEYCGSKYCIGTGNGLDALQLILRSCEIGSGDEVLIPSNTFIATALSVSHVGATPVFVEPDQRTLLIDPKNIEKNITSKTRAIMAVHLYGRVADMEAVNEIAQRYGLMVFEDTAQAHGAERNGKKAGTFGKAGAFSFYPGKNLGAFGDGGAVITDDKELADKVRMLGNYGSHQKYKHELKGINSRLDELQAAFLSVKLKQLDMWTKERKRIAKIYYEQIHNEKIELPVYTEENVYHIFPVLCDVRDDLQQHLLSRGIHTLVHYPQAMHLQKAYEDMGKGKGTFPVAENICARELSIPLYPGLTDDEIRYIIESLNQF